MLKILPVRLAFDAIEEVEPEVTAAAAAAIEVDVGKAVMDDAAEDDPGIQKTEKIVKLMQDIYIRKIVNSLKQSKNALDWAKQ